MVEYNAAIDAQISEQLGLRGYVTVESLPGFDAEQTAAFLRRYVEIHSAERPFSFDGERMTWAAAAASPQQPATEAPYGYQQTGSYGPPAGQPAPSPVDQVLAVGGGKALLDSGPVGAPVNKALWLLPLSLLLPGGIVGWLVVRRDNPRAGRMMLILGVIFTVLTFATTPALKNAMPSTFGAITSAAWPASTTGKPTFYYFGTSN